MSELEGPLGIIWSGRGFNPGFQLLPQGSVFSHSLSFGLAVVIPPTLLPPQKACFVPRGPFHFLHLMAIEAHGTFTTAKRWKRPKYPCTDEQTKMVHLCDGILSMEGNKVLTHTTKWTNLENMLSERHQTQKDIDYVIPLIWKIGNRQLHRDGK